MQTNPILIAALVSFSLPAAAAARPITLAVDASEAPRHILHARMVIPARPGPLTLRYPKWIPGEHAPTGPIQLRAGCVSGGGAETFSETSRGL